MNTKVNTNRSHGFRLAGLIVGVLALAIANRAGGLPYWLALPLVAAVVVAASKVARR